MISRPALKLFLAALILYNLNCRPIPSGDTVTAALLPLELVLHGTANFDNCKHLLRRSYDGHPYFLHVKDGHRYSTYPVAQPLLLTPLYLPLALVPGARSWPGLTMVLIARILEKVMASLIASASVAVLFLILRRMASERRALLLAAVYAFATSTWSTSSQALWQHTGSQLTIVVSLLCLVRYLEDSARWRDAVGAGLFAALSVAMRPTNLLFFAVSLAVIFWRARRRPLLASYAGFGVSIGTALAVYNWQLFGHLTGGYSQPFDGAFFVGLAGLMVSPSHGLFVFSPVLLFALPGAYFCLRNGGPPGPLLGPIAVLFTMAHVALCSLWPCWWGGDCYGPRMLVDVLPCLILLLSGALDWIARHRLLKGAFAATLAFSVAVQFVGAFCFPLGFDAPEPLWDWRRCPIVENAQCGLTPRPYQVVAGWADDLLHGRLPDPTKTGLLIR